MLRQRVVTAVVLLALLLPALFAASSLPFVLLMLLMISAAGWEWARLNGVTGTARALGSGLLLALWCGATLRVLPPVGQSATLWAAATALWIVGAGVALWRGPSGWPALARPVRWAVGLLLLWLAWTALAQARVIGVNFLLSVLCLVWAADIAAYFGGRAFGRRKLAPTISPGKSWAGVYSGVAGVMLLAGLWLWADAHWTFDSPSLYKLLLQRLGAIGLAPALVLLVALSVVGDLFESLVKRAAGAKDSSRLLPGHGGVLDRIDALLPVLPAALALTSF